MKHLITLLLALWAGSCLHAQASQEKTIDVFKKGESGYNCFRIPAIVRCAPNTLLAFAEARKNSCSDTGDIDLVVKRSEDGGKTWGPIILVWEDGDNVCGNPSPIVDEKTGNIVLLSCWNLGEDHEKQIIDGTSKDTRRVYVLHSDDQGKTWSKPTDITASVKKTNWTWYATGPCHGIQLRGPKHEGRMVMSSNHMEAGTKAFRSQLIYSDDQGKTWKLGAVVSKPGGNESSVVELSDGRLMLNMRNYNREESKTRSFAISDDGGQSLSDMRYLPELIEPICQGSTLNLSEEGRPGKRILFSNPASTDKRIKMTIRLSEDNGQTWPYAYLVHEGPSAYSDLVDLGNGNVGLLYEYGKENPYERIGFVTIPVEELKKK